MRNERQRWFAIAAFCALVAPASAQTAATIGRDLEAALASAQAAAVRPGDDSLGCDALERELVAAANDPALHAVVAKHGEAAKQQMEAMKTAQGRAATQAALTVFGSLVPGGDWAVVAAAMAQAPAQRADAAANVQMRMQQAREMMPLMPQLMRGQRVVELAQTRDCAWLRDAGGR